MTCKYGICEFRNQFFNVVSNEFFTLSDDLFTED